MRLIALALLPATATLLLVPATAPPTAGERMATAATGFLAALDSGQRKAATFPFPDDERRAWHFVPRRYPGVELGELDGDARRAAHALLRSGLSNTGYLQTTAIMQLEDVLRRAVEASGGDAPHRDPGRYAFAVFGDPAAETPWGWRVQGHHVSLNFTVHGDTVHAHTPWFFGANPHERRRGVFTGMRVLGAEEDHARALLASLDDEQRQRAIIADEPPGDVLLGPGADAGDLEARGVAAATFDVDQHHLLQALIDSYVEDLPAGVAAREAERLRAAGTDAVRFCWAGGTEPGRPHYWCLQGPGFVIEYANVQNGANHAHTVWRDPADDFGRHALRDHLREEHR